MADRAIVGYSHPDMVCDDWRQRVCEWLRDGRRAFPPIDTSDVGRFLDFVETEGIAGILFAEMQRRPQPGNARLNSRLAEINYRNAAHALVVQHEVCVLSQHFHRASLRPLVIKGTALAHSHYPAPYLRPCCDTDLIVDRAEAPRLEALLYALGYRRLPAVSGRLVTQQFSMAKDVSGFTHVLDIHFEITNSQMFAGILPFQMLSADARKIPRLGVWTPHLVSALLLACIHRVVHHQNTERLIWLYDIHLLVADLSAAEQLQFAELARANHVAGIAEQSVAASRRFFGTTLSDAARSLLREADHELTEFSTVYLRTQRTLASDLWLNLRYCRSWPARLTLVKETLFPPPSYLLAQRRNAHRALLPVYYVARILKGVAKYVRRRGAAT